MIIAVATALLWLSRLATQVTGQEVTGFTLINAESDIAIGPIVTGDTIDLNSVGTKLSIRADTSSATKSIRFGFDGIANFQVESAMPYALGGDIGGNYAPVASLAVKGSHSVSATPYSETMLGGSKGATLTINFSVSAVAVTPAPPANNDVLPYNHGPQGVLTGELRKWHKVTLGFEGPATSETSSTNPFSYYALNVSFNHSVSGKTYRVPGYFAADGNAANTQASSGNVWLVHFCPDQTWKWLWNASFSKGTNVAQNGGGSSAGFFDGAAGTFSISSTNKSGRDNRAKGRLQYVGKHHLQFAETSEWFLKAGADSPENFLAYEEFDSTPNYMNLRKSWLPHQDDYKAGDPTWAGGRGKEIIGAINYLSAKGMNAFSFLTMNIGGDDKNVFPYISDAAGSHRQRIDVSKTAQWEVVFEHADHNGLFLHFKTQEQENDQLLDNGSLGLERKLYYRELIARFSHHLALNWNLGEENSNTDAERKQFSNYFKAIDPYDSPVVVHDANGLEDQIYAPLLGHPTFDGASLQCGELQAFSDTLKWVQESKAAGRKWIVTNDEQNDYRIGVLPDANDPTHDAIRKNFLWGNVMAGGAGVEYYFGSDYPNSDLTCNDYRSRDAMWDQSRYLLQFFKDNKIPFWEMENSNNLVSPASVWCLAKPGGDVYIVYIKDRLPATIDLARSGTYTVKWFSPFAGGALQEGSTTRLIGGKNDLALGNPPNNNSQDWAILIRLEPLGPVPPPTPPPSPPPTTMIPGFVLMDAISNQKIQQLVNGAVIDGTAKNVRFDPIGSVGSVIFGLDDDGSFRTENVSPFALAGDQPVGDYLPYTFSSGQHTVTATPYTQANGNGIAGTTMSVTFRVV